MTDAGYIKFNLDWQEGPPPNGHETAELQEWRTVLWQKGLIGVTEHGIGYGNISVRAGNNNQFIISCTQTGALPELSNENYCRITGFDIFNNQISAIGSFRPSSEALTHAACYAANPLICAVIHVHHSQLWQCLLRAGPSRSPNAPYGSKELAMELTKLLADKNTGQAQLIALAGHTDGVLSVGHRLEHAATALIDEL